MADGGVSQPPIKKRGDVSLWLTEGLIKFNRLSSDGLFFCGHGTSSLTSTLKNLHKLSFLTHKICTFCHSLLLSDNILYNHRAKTTFVKVNSIDKGRGII